MDVFEYLLRDKDAEDMSITELKWFVKGWNACAKSNEPQKTLDLTYAQIVVMREHWLKYHRELPED